MNQPWAINSGSNPRLPHSLPFWRLPTAETTIGTVGLPFQESRFIRRYADTTANTLDTQMLPRLLDPENEYDYFWADLAFSGECFEDQLTLCGFESRIHERDAPYHPLSDAAKERNSIKSSIRACVEHVFGWI